jgi:hypothetical protein
VAIEETDMNSRPNQILSCDARKTARRLLEQGKTEREILDVIGDEWRGNYVTATEYGWNYWSQTKFHHHPTIHQWFQKAGKRLKNRIQGV